MGILIGSTLGTYRVQAEVGRGGMGIVYRSQCMRIGHSVALKVLFSHLSQDQAFVRRFWDEYQTVRSLYHRNIVRVYEFGIDQGYCFIAAEYIAGASLEQQLTRRHTLSLQETVDIVAQVAAALDAVHPRGIVHQDLKPSNILLERGGRAVLTDFGIASIVGWQSTLSRDGSWGTPEYMAPEQARGDPHITHRADIYALGIVTYEMLTGRVPFPREEPLAAAYAQIHETPPPLRSIRGARRLPANAESVVMQALQKDPLRRPLRAGIFARQLATAARVRQPGAHRRQPKARRRGPGAKRQQRPSILALVAGIGLVVVLLLGGALILPSLGSETEPGALAYACQIEEETRICLRDETGHQQVFACGSRDWAPAWSPDGGRIAFSSDREGSTDIWILEPGSGAAYPVAASSLTDESSPSWSPDGERIAYDARVSGSYDIYVQEVGESAARRLTWEAARDSDPAWSPAGDRIAFVSDRDGDLEIYVIDVDGGGLIRLTTQADWDFAPAWSPDGRQIAYECADNTGDDIEICTMDASGGNRRVLTHNSVDDRQPVWSPDGQLIAFCRERPDGSLWDIWVMEPDGANQRVWVQDGYSNTHPSWKP